MNAYAQTLAPVAAASSTFDPWMFGAILVVVLAVVAFVWYHKKNPTGAAALTATAGADLKAVGSDIATELSKLRGAVEAHMAVTAAGPAAAEPATPAPAPGKNGTPGPLTLQLTGDPATDAKAFNAAYFG